MNEGNAMQNPDTTLSSWTILGSGAIGGLWALRLHQLGIAVALLDTRPSAHTSTRPLILREAGHPDYRADFSRLTCADITHLDGTLLVTTKAWQVIPALTPLITGLPTGVTIVLLHNGMGTEAWVRQHFPAHRLIVGTTSCGAMIQGSSILATGLGETWLGQAARSSAQVDISQTELPPAWLGNWQQAFGHTEWTIDIARYQWRKLIVNAVINPLTALAHQPNRWILSQADQVSRLCAELLPLLHQLGFTESQDDWVQLVLQVAERTGSNYSSMERDLATHRPTEIDFITGHILQEATRKGLELPLHCALYQRIKAEESPYTSGSGKIQSMDRFDHKQF